MARRTALWTVAVGIFGFCIAGCGESDNSQSVGQTATDTRSPSEQIRVPSSFSSCPGARQTYIMGSEAIASAREGIEAGEEVAESRKLLKTGEELIAQSYEGCGVEREGNRLEAKICRNSPQVIAEGLEIEDTPANREYVEVYEVTCGRKVPLP